MFGENSRVIQNENHDYLEYRIVCIWKGSDCGTRKRAYEQRVSVALREWVSQESYS